MAGPSEKVQRDNEIKRLRKLIKKENENLKKAKKQERRLKFNIFKKDELERVKSQISEISYSLDCKKYELKRLIQKSYGKTVTGANKITKEEMLLIYKYGNKYIKNNYKKYNLKKKNKKNSTSTSKVTVEDTVKDLVTFEMMKEFGWKGFKGKLNDTKKAKLITVNEILKYYSITDMKSIRLFMATCGHESGKGFITLENLNADGTTVGRYKKTERGAGYIQITWRDTHLKFLKTVEENGFTGEDTATYISKNYPWQAAGWFWSTKDAKSTSVGSLNDYVVMYGDSLNVFLVTQFFVNGWPRYKRDTKILMPNSYATDIRDGKVSWTINKGILTVHGEQFTAPVGWNTAKTGRKDCYNSAKKIFK